MGLGARRRKSFLFFLSVSWEGSSYRTIFGVWFFLELFNQSHIQEWGRRRCRRATWDEGVLLPASVTYVTEAFFLRQRDVYILGTGYFRGGGLLRELGRDGKGRFLLSKPSTPPPSHNRGQRILAKFAPLISSSRHKVDQSFEGCWNRGAQVPPWRTMY